MRLLAMILTTMLALTALNAAAFEKTAKFKTTQVVYSAEKPLVVGTNELHLMLTKKGQAVGDAQVIVKVFMPEMPGMPYMEYVANAQAVGNGKYKATVNFSMGGTWQIHIFVHTPDGKKQRIKSSVNL